MGKDRTTQMLYNSTHSANYPLPVYGPSRKSIKGEARAIRRLTAIIGASLDYIIIIHCVFWVKTK